MKDLIILGNGMAGMTAALYAKRANLDFKIVGRDEYDFGQIGNAILVENFPCVESQSGFDLAMKLHDQLIANEIKIEEHEIIKVDICFSKNGERYWTVLYKDGAIDKSKTIIYALGASHRKLDIDTTNAPIHYCALCDGALYKDKDVAVIGGGDVAFTQAEYLSKICSNIYILMCDENVTAAPSTFNRVSKINNVSIIYNYAVKKIKMVEKGYLLSCFEEDNKKLYTKYGLVVDGVFVAIGMIPNTKPLYGVTDYIITNEETLHSSSLGLFAAGDVRLKKVRQALTAAADGAIAVSSVIDYLKSYSKLKVVTDLNE